MDQSRIHELGSVGLSNLLAMDESRRGLCCANDFEAQQLLMKQEVSVQNAGSVFGICCLIKDRVAMERL